jgi:hemerythrin
MGFLEWDERYNTGIPEMDKQHQKWVSILNEFYQNINNNFIVDPQGWTRT